MTTSNEHNNAPAVPQGWKLVPIEPTKEMLDVGLKRKAQARWVDGALVLRTRTENLRPAEEIAALQWEAMLAATPAPAPAQYKDSTPHLSVGESSFESWFESYNPANKGDKQRSRDAYAAGMGDPLVAPAPAQGEPFGHFRPEPFGWTDCAKDDEGAIALYERPQEVGLTDGDLLNWIERQDLEELSMGVVIDAPHDGEYYVNGDDCVTYYGKTLRNAIIAALRAKGGK